MDVGVGVKIDQAGVGWGKQVEGVSQPRSQCRPSVDSSTHRRGHRLRREDLKSCSDSPSVR